MSFIEAFLLSLALCVDSLVVSATTAFRSRMGWRQGVLMAVVFGLCQGAFPLAGALVGDTARSFIESVDHWVAFGLLASIGCKMVLDAIRSKGGEKAAGHRQPGLPTFFLLGVATSIDAFAVGIGLGLQHPLPTVLWVAGLIALVTLAVSAVGAALGRRSIPIPERTATLIAGLVLITLGAKILIEHIGC